MNWRPGSAAIRSSAFRVSVSSVTKSRPMATAVAGTSKTTAATMRWNRLTSRTLRGRVERVLGELTSGGHAGSPSVDSGGRSHSSSGVRSTATAQKANASAISPQARAAPIDARDSPRMPRGGAGWDKIIATHPTVGIDASESETHQDRAEDLADEDEHRADTEKPVGPHGVDEGGGSVPLLDGQPGPQRSTCCSDAGNAHPLQVGDQVDAECDHGQHRSATPGQPRSRQERGNEGQHGDEARAA